jgi:hypothetical protein
LLWYTLQSIPDLRRHVLIDCSERIINYTDGRFIRQALRGVGTMEQRLTVLRSEVGRIVEIITDGGQAN